MSYNLGAVIGWKFDHRPGMSTADGVITEWPEETKPTDAEIATWTAEYEAHLASVEYQENRREAYPLISDQLDMMYWDAINGTKDWADAIGAVKAAHPKPE